MPPSFHSTDIRDAVPTGLDLQVITIRRAWSGERRSFWIQETKVKNPAMGNMFQVFNIDAIVLIENANTFFVFGDRGSTSKGCDQAGSQSRCA
jgi:hypothetical protein